MESLAVLVVATVFANAAYQAGTERAQRTGIALDARTALAVGIEYQATACDSGVVAADVATMAAALALAMPKDAGRWTVRYAGARPATAGAGPLRASGVRMRVELANASAVERGVIRSMGGWVEGTTAMLAQARPEQGRMRVRRARLARGLTTAERASGC